jgi:hypothetical protein
MQRRQRAATRSKSRLLLPDVKIVVAVVLAERAGLAPSAPSISGTQSGGLRDLPSEIRQLPCGRRRSRKIRKCVTSRGGTIAVGMKNAAPSASAWIWTCGPW